MKRGSLSKLEQKNGFYLHFLLFLEILLFVYFSFFLFLSFPDIAPRGKTNPVDNWYISKSAMNLINNGRDLKI